MAASPLLALPQELRDLIYRHALSDTLTWSEESVEQRTTNVGMSTAPEAWKGSLTLNYPTQCPRPVWYTLLRCCRTTNSDIRDLAQTTALKQKSDIPPAVVDLLVSSKTATTIWQSIPCHPRQVSEMHVNIGVSDIDESCFVSGAPEAGNAIIFALIQFLRRYCKYGPHLAREVPLEISLKLEAVVLHFGVNKPGRGFTIHALTPPIQAGAHWIIQQLATISGVSLIWLGRLARSGLLWEHVERLKWEGNCIAEMEGEVFKVTNHVWHEEDRKMFQRLGYSWN